MLIISIDVGIRNLAYVIIKVKELNIHNIIEWNVIELCDKKEKASSVLNEKIGYSIYTQFDDILNTYKFDKIIIENQIGKNAIKMKTIQGMITMYFIMKDYDINNIISYNACHKLKHFIENKKTTYNERKKISKEITKCLCEKYYDIDIMNYYNDFKKKDDLADCLLQALDFIKKKKLLENIFFYKIKI